MLKYLIGINLLLIVMIFFYNGYLNNDQPEIEEDELVEVSRTEQQSKHPDDLATIEIVLQRQYLDGRMDSEVFEETITSMEDFWYTYEPYQLIDQKMGQMIFREYLDDISPYLKEVGYFGLSEQQLTIFEGEPQYEQVIQQVYDLDLEALPKDKQEKLRKGIKIDSKQIYQDTIEVFRNHIPSEQVQGESG
ncbi:BofC C-terminal domain-containing protein [Amphibacillus jilinensis]|uniref:BofC C-terminal domain-containing protein n=1 Tax=Amphibacillus jilinensis TaxID=1216008 RepID=UPI0002E637C9|nr:BofC C-terminal domain-containing protein [Amphibacillus jilinensis]